MPRSSPARSQGAPETSRRNKPRSSRSMGSPARSTASGRLTNIVDKFKDDNKDSFAVSPLSKTVLSDNTEIELPRRRSWWKKVENSRDVIEVLESETNKQINPANVLEEFDVDVLSQEKQNNYALDLPESSGSESVSSIVVPQRKLFTQKENVPQKKFSEVAGNRESLAKLNKTNFNDKTVEAGPKKLFGQTSKRPKPVFPSALLNMSLDKTSNKTKEIATEVMGQPKTLFSNRPGTKRKKMFADFIVSESEDEIRELQPKRFTFNKHSEPTRRSSAASRGLRDPSPTSSCTTDIEMEEWKLLPSSTMVEHQLQSDLGTPGKRARLSKLSEAKESTKDSSKQSIKLIASKNKSLLSPDKTRVINKTVTVTKNVSTSLRERNIDDENEQPIELGLDDANEISNAKDKTRVINKTVTLTKNISKSQTINEMHENNQPQDVPEVNETSNAKDKTRTINKTVNKSMSKTQNDNVLDKDLGQEITRDQVAPGVPDQLEDDVEIALTYEDNDAEDIQENIDNKSKLDSETKNEINNRHQSFDNIEKQSDKEKSQRVSQEHNEENNEQQEEAELASDEESERESNNEAELNYSDEANEDQNEDETEEQEIEQDENEQELEDRNEEDDEDQQRASAEVEEENKEEVVEQESDNSVELDDNDEVEEQDDNEETQIEQEESENEEEVVEQESDNEVELDDNDEVEEQDDNEETQIEQEENENEEEVVEQESDNEVELDDNDEVEEQDDNEETQIEQEKSQEHEDEEQEGSQNEEDEEIQESDSEGENENDTPVKTENNFSHDTTGRNRKTRRTESIEAPRFHETSNEMDSFHANSRNTSVRMTKSVLKNFTLRASIAPAKETTGLSDGVPNSSAEGSGWDSHRTTRKTLRQTFGKDFTPRKSLRALVIEKSAKRQTVINEANAQLNQANSTEINYNDDMNMGNDENIDPAESDHEASKRMQQTNLEMYLQKVMKENLERKQKIEQQVINSLKRNQPSGFDILNFRVPNKPTTRKAKTLASAPKAKRVKQSIIPLGNLPSELREDMNYKPPKRFKPSNASWITKRLYKFLETKLEPKYDYRARIRAEKLVETIYNFVRDTKRMKVAPAHSVAELKKEMARLDIVATHFEFYNFFSDYMPMEVKIKVVPDVINDIPVPRDIFAPILE